MKGRGLGGLDCGHDFVPRMPKQRNKVVCIARGLCVLTRISAMYLRFSQCVAPCRLAGGNPDTKRGEATGVQRERGRVRSTVLYKE